MCFSISCFLLLCVVLLNKKTTCTGVLEMPLPPFLSNPERPVVPYRWSTSYRIIIAIELMHAAGVRITARRIQGLCCCSLDKVHGWMSRNETRMPPEIEILSEFAHRRKLRQAKVQWMQSRLTRETSASFIQAIDTLHRNRRIVSPVA